MIDHKPMGKDEFKERLERIYGNEGVLEDYRLSPKSDEGLEKMVEMSRFFYDIPAKDFDISFDFENVCCTKGSHFDNIDSKKQSLLGLQSLGNFQYLGCAAGGDWEIAVFFAAYFNKEGKLRAYVPKEGNIFKKEGMIAYGNDCEGNETDEHIDDRYDWGRIEAEIKGILKAKSKGKKMIEEKLKEDGHKPSDFYFSTPFKLEDMDCYWVVITTKSLYDKKGKWDDGGVAYNAMKTLLPKGFGEAAESVFEAPPSMAKEDVMALLAKKGFVHNRKLDDDAKSVYGIFDEEKEALTVFMMIGLPASGKSYIAKQLYGDLPLVSKDLCNGSKAKERKQLEDLLAEGKDVVVDDTNYNAKNRAEIIGIAEKYGADVIGVYVKVSKEKALERNKVRENKVPAAAIHSIAKNFEEPELSEGFTKLNVIDND